VADGPLANATSGRRLHDLDLDLDLDLVTDGPLANATNGRRLQAALDLDLVTDAPLANATSGRRLQAALDLERLRLSLSLLLTGVEPQHITLTSSAVPGTDTSLVVARIRLPIGADADDL
jgi:hypothetical protein